MATSSDEPKEDSTSSLPSKRGWRTPLCYQFQGFWYTPLELEAAMAFQQRFQALDSDLLLITQPKSGTTWLKALVFVIAHRSRFRNPRHLHPLLTNHPHDLVPSAEQSLGFGQTLDLARLPLPRILATHCPSASLPQSVMSSCCRIVYLCRNPRDTFVSWWHFTNRLREETQVGPPLSLEEGLEMFSMGASDYGPYWDHALGYWRESLERPERVLFLKYEELKGEPGVHLRRLARHLRFPFSPETEREEVEEILELCSFEKMVSLEVNRRGRNCMGLKREMYFRKGEVGDWANYLTAEMIERLENQSQKSFAESGLTFSNVLNLGEPN